MTQGYLLRKGRRDEGKIKNKGNDGDGQSLVGKFSVVNSGLGEWLLELSKIGKVRSRRRARGT